MTASKPTRYWWRMHTENPDASDTPPAIDEDTAHAVLDAEADADARWRESADSYAWALETEVRRGG